MTKFEELQAEHQRLLNQVEAKGSPDELLSAVKAYLERVRVDAQFVPAPRDRDQLRANLRFWASYVFDKTGTYPETTLRPAMLTSEPPSAKAQEISPIESAIQRLLQRAWVSVGIIAVLTGLVLAVALISRGTVANGPPTTPATATIAIAIVETRTATPVPPTVPPTAIRSTPTPAVILIPAVQLTPKPTLQPPFEPGGGGGDFPVLAARAIPNGTDCGKRSITIAFDRRQTLPAGAASAIHVRLTRVGTGELVISSTLDRREAATVDVTALGTKNNASVLIQADGQDLIFASVIVPFAADCKGNQVLVDYSTESQYASSGSSLPSSSNPNLDLSWYVLTWGPSPYDQSWVAELKLQAVGGDGHYVYWADNVRLADDRIVIQGQPCEVARSVIGVTSGGESTRRNVMLVPPILYCP